MRLFLILLFSSIFILLLITTIQASFHQNVIDAIEPIWNDPWSRATLLDAYFGFITFFVWVAYKEKEMWKKILWFVLIMCLGNFAMSGYALWQISRLKPGEPLEKILLRNESQTTPSENL